MSIQNSYILIMHYNLKIMGSSLNQIMRNDNCILILYFTSIEFHTHGYVGDQLFPTLDLLALLQNK